MSTRCVARDDSRAGRRRVRGGVAAGDSLPVPDATVAAALTALAVGAGTGTARGAPVAIAAAPSAATTCSTAGGAPPYCGDDVVAEAVRIGAGSGGGATGGAALALAPPLNPCAATGAPPLSTTARSTTRVHGYGYYGLPSSHGGNGGLAAQHVHN